MKAESNIKPERVRVERLGESAIVIMSDAVIAEERDGKPLYVYEEYKCRTGWRPELIDQINEAFDLWISSARNAEVKELSTMARAKRNALISSTDWMVASDAPLTASERQTALEYRQKLRDIPEQPGFPKNIIWPEL